VGPTAEISLVENSFQLFFRLKLVFQIGLYQIQSGLVLPLGKIDRLDFQGAREGKSQLRWDARGPAWTSGKANICGLTAGLETGRGPKSFLRNELAPPWSECKLRQLRTIRKGLSL